MILILTWVNKTFPSLERKIAWNQPMFIDHGTFIIGFSHSKNHIAIAIEKFAQNNFINEIKASNYKQSSMLFYIEWKQDINYKLLEKMINFNIADKKDCTTFWRNTH